MPVAFVAPSGPKRLPVQTSAAGFAILDEQRRADVWPPRFTITSAAFGSL